MKQVVSSLAVMALLVGFAPRCAWAAPDTLVAGVVRDAHGSPQTGALVELLGPDAVVFGRAITDSHGRYLFEHILPGTYKLRASAAFLLPAIRSNLAIHAGAQALADLTMTALFEAGSWLPTETRSPSDHPDDWRWALRSTANRPMLRLIDDPAAADSGVSSSADHAHGTRTSGQVAVLAGDGRFGEGGTHQVLSLGRAGPAGDISLLTANLGDNASQGAGSSVALAGGLERGSSNGGQTHLYLSFASHPELQTGQGGNLGVLQTAATELLSLGDAVIIDAGTLFTVEHLVGTRFDSAPYLRVAFQPTPGLSLEYRLATSKALQASSDLDEINLADEALSDAGGHPLLKKSLHQELSLTQSIEKSHINLGIFHDSIPVESIQGSGALAEQDLQGLPVIADPTTGTLRVAVRGYSATGVRVAWTQAISSVWSACIEGDFGGALTAVGGPGLHLADVPGQVHMRTAGAVRGSLHAAARRTGTSATLHYRLQPRSTLTQVDEFDSQVGDASLGVSLRQRLWAGRRLSGLSAVVEASNLLAQGYEPLVGPDGQTLFLAQVPRAIQAGLAFTF